jgi:hypothetical protein
MTATRFAREVELRWRRLHDGTATVLSPADWSVVQRWYELGIPLALVDEALEAASERRGSLPKSVARLDRAVRNAWATVRAGRVARPPE